jgi:hypothetical protein
MISDAFYVRCMRFGTYTFWALFVVSLCLPALYQAGAPQPSLGIGLLIGGALGIIASQFGWFANPLMLYAMLSLSIWDRPRVVTASLAAVLALSSLTIGSLPTDDGNRLVTFGPGLYIWVFCSILVASMSFFAWYRKNNLPVPD